MINALDQAPVAVLCTHRESSSYSAIRPRGSKKPLPALRDVRTEKSSPGPSWASLTPATGRGATGKVPSSARKGYEMQEIKPARERARDQADRQTLKRASNGENLDGANDEDIPDYVMRDFDPPRSRTGRLEASSGCGMKSLCDWVYRADVPTHYAVKRAVERRKRWKTDTKDAGARTTRS